MSILYTETKSDTDSRTEIALDDGRHLHINITGEGIILDLYECDGLDLEPTTVGMMFDEWAEWILGLMPRAFHMSNE